MIYCGDAFRSRVAELEKVKPFIVTDSTVYALYKPLLDEKFAGAPVFVFPAGEKSKNATVLFKILKKMVECGVNRYSTVVAFGGGVVGDIAGLAAALYMRGVRLVQIPTTLLSQVDSSVGGKTAVDFMSVKNLVGTFYQPDEVIADPMFLKTLPKREIRCGLGEIIKYGALDKEIFSKLEANSENLFAPDFFGAIVPDCIEHKARVVEGDEHDKGGARKTLNFGHTTGHAFELYYKRKSHGEFVMIGSYYEAYIAVRKGICAPEYAERLINLIKCAGVKIPAYDDIEKAAAFAAYDKKNRASGEVSLIVPKDIGECEELVLGSEEYISLIRECRDKIRSGK